MIRGTKRPRVKAIEIIEPKAQKINAKLNASIHNRFDIEVVDAKTGEIKQRVQAENIICDALWTKLLTPASYFNYLHYGTGSGTPAATDTSLFTFLGYGTPSTSDDVYAFDMDNGYVSLTRKIQLPETTAVGSTLTEVGIGYSTTSATLCTHAMLRDMNGNPISIAKTATDIINIYATVFVHFDADGYDSGYIKICPPAALTLSGFSSSFLRYLVGIASSPSVYPAFFIGGASPQTASSLIGNQHVGSFSIAYSSAAKTITLTAVRLGVGDANVNYGIGAIAILGYKINTSNPTEYIPYLWLKVGGAWCSGTEIIGEAIGTGDGNTIDFATDFDRLDAGSTIYVNSIAQASGVTVDSGAPFRYTDMGRYFELIEISPSTNKSSFPTPFIEANMVTSDIGAYTIYFNPFYSYGIKSFSTSSVTVEVSDDLSTWVDVTADKANIPAAYRTYKYWKITSTVSSGFSYASAMTADAITSATNIHFDIPPAAGAVITADYVSETIAKDPNHVFDLTVTIQLGEYTE